MAVVVAEDERTHAQRRRRRGHRGQGRDGRQLVAEVVRHEQGAVAEVLGLACLLGPAPGRAVGRLAQLCGEPEPAIVCHGSMLPQIRPACPRVPDGPAGPPATSACCIPGGGMCRCTGVPHLGGGRGGPTPTRTAPTSGPVAPSPSTAYPAPPTRSSTWWAGRCEPSGAPPVPRSARREEPGQIAPRLASSRASASRSARGYWPTMGFATNARIIVDRLPERAASTARRS